MRGRDGDSGDGHLHAAACACHGQPAPTVQLLIGLLSVRGRTHRTRIAQLLWPDLDLDRGLANLRTATWRARRTSRRLLDIAPDTLGIHPEVEVDLFQVQHVVDRALDDQTAPEDLPAVAELDVGELLAGWSYDWLLLERESPPQSQLHALGALCYRLLDVGRPAEALRAALCAYRQDVLRESAVRAMITVYLSEHNAVEA